MKLSELRNIILEVLEELNEQSTTGTGASFTPGTGAQYATPNAFGKQGTKNKATKYGEKLGYKIVKQKKRPYNTKMYDYLNENTTRKI
jgi:hypothetical protein|tara:strand:+ start:3959 stop:4222 length:264 start_codon:yes stop_codon:yes gene_type:complete